MFTQELFCRRCQKVVEHGIYARENYSTYGGMESHIPLLCSCSKCDTLFVAFSHEFVFCRTDKVNNDYAKIYGRNRISPGNWLYFKGHPKPGMVRSFFQGPEQEIINISYDGEPPQKIECPKSVIAEEESPDGYRLLPSQSGVTLIGDHVYHAIRDQFGVCVGFVNDGDKDKLVVFLENKIILFITIPEKFQNQPNDKLCLFVRNRLTQVFPDDVDRISVTAGQGIIFLKGFVRNLSTKRLIKACINSIPKVRGCVDFSRVQSDVSTSDVQIEQIVYSLLESPQYHLFDYEVEVSFGKVKISASCAESKYSKDFEIKVGEIPGVLDLICNIEQIPDASIDNLEQCTSLESDLAGHSLLQGAKISVTYSRKKFLIEGHVVSAMQKRVAFLAVVKNLKTTAIENRLRQIL
ncbi:MAG: BON domain-containing protein [Fibrobacter sp.]|nr:BON domain-containing protein [Fibrobacter sp.]